MRAARRHDYGAARVAILDAAVDVIRVKGYRATTVDDLCAAAGVTKGAFFHHFASKDDLAVAAADHWSETTGALFAAAEYHTLDDPIDRILAYVDLRIELTEGRSLPEFTCLVGTMAQETYETSPAIRDACGRSILGHAATLVDDLTAALHLVEGATGDHGARAESLATHLMAVVQGAFVVAKAAGDPELARDSLVHLRRYLELVLGRHGNLA